MRDKVTRQCPQTTTFQKKGEPKQIRTEVPLLTSLTPYHWAKPARGCTSRNCMPLYQQQQQNKNCTCCVSPLPTKCFVVQMYLLVLILKTTFHKMDGCSVLADFPKGKQLKFPLEIFILYKTEYYKSSSLCGVCQAQLIPFVCWLHRHLPPPPPLPSHTQSYSSYAVFQLVSLSDSQHALQCVLYEKDVLLTGQSVLHSSTVEEPQDKYNHPCSMKIVGQ